MQPFHLRAVERGGGPAVSAADFYAFQQRKAATPRERRAATRRHRLGGDPGIRGGAPMPRDTARRTPRPQPDRRRLRRPRLHDQPPLDRDAMNERVVLARVSLNTALYATHAWSATRLTELRARRGPHAACRAYSRAWTVHEHELG